MVKTDVGNQDGQNKCPKCGSTDISTNVKKGCLRCNFCRYEFDPQKIEGLETDISKLEGQIIASGATDIVADTKDVLTFKCSSCGAEVVIDTKDQLQARCHWCRNTLSVNQQIPNGAVPDVVLPFSITKEQAKAKIEEFVGKRKFFAHPVFTQEFKSDNVMGVYFPYMLIDVNAHANFSGEGEHQTRMYYVSLGENRREARYDADRYHVEREFDIAINGLSIESNSSRLDNSDKTKTNNIINSIMPFDVENCVKYNANYLNGYTSERRDTNVEGLKDVVDAQSKDVARFAANDYLKNYDRGVCWETEDFKIKGQQWKTAYLPVWLYSYYQKDKNLMHYVAVNARTLETMGSVPINYTKLFLISFVIEILCFFAFMSNILDDYSVIFLAGGFIYFFVMKGRYRNASARHDYEKSTKKDVSNLRNVDDKLKHLTGLKNSMIDGCNNTRLEGEKNKNKVGSIGKKLIESAIPDKDLVGFVEELDKEKENIDKKDNT
ncbi:MAG: TFIIB-type zinc ribbon-containing protein [Bacilli bacterium]|nr:TFIIB-type zinc ribbon-containing protein [Bacilli bacterium]